MFSLRKLTFLLLVFFTENPVFSTDSNLFLDPFPTDELDDTSLSASAFLLPWSSSPDYIIGATDGISENESSGSLFTDDDSLLLLTSCVDNNNPQQQLLQKNKARAKTKRDGFGSTVCPQNGAPLPPVPLPVPQFPDLLNSIIGPSDGERWKDEEGDFAGAAVSMNTAEFYCALWTSKPRVYKKPVCGSGNYEDMVRVARAFYSYVANSRLGKYLFSFFLCFCFFVGFSGFPSHVFLGFNSLTNQSRYTIAHILLRLLSKKKKKNTSIFFSS